VGGGVARGERDGELAVDEALRPESLGVSGSWELRSWICCSVSIVDGSGHNDSTIPDVILWVGDDSRQGHGKSHFS